MSQKNSLLIANLSWNQSGWKKPIINHSAGHSYARNFPGHESLNFNFSKKNIDTDNTIYGYIEIGKRTIRNFENGGIFIFYSKDTNKNIGQIIGIYGNVTILEKKRETPYQGFENNKFLSNISADKNLSLLFPIYLNDSKYKKYTKKNRLVGQVGFSYYQDKSILEEIIYDEIKSLIHTHGKYQKEIQKLKDIYKYYIYREFDYDSIEQQIIIDNVVNLSDSNIEKISVTQKIYKRNNLIIAKIKQERNFACQICQTKILKSNGTYYIEAAHIQAKKDKGAESRENILILCPNHHKEFDFGNRKIIKHQKDKIIFKLNNIEYNLSLR